MNGQRSQKKLDCIRIDFQVKKMRGDYLNTLMEKQSMIGWICVTMKKVSKNHFNSAIKTNKFQ